MTRVYVAGPMKSDPGLGTKRAINAADELLRLGFIPFVPHLSYLWHAVSPKPYDEWIRIDLEWLTVCDALLRLPGESGGAEIEVALAKGKGIPVFGSIPELLDWRKGCEQMATFQKSQGTPKRSS